jgi:hypothetical protein
MESSSFFSRATLVVLFLAGCSESQVPASAPTPNRPQREQGQEPAEVFLSVLAELKEKAEVPILLPSELPGPKAGLWAFGRGQTAEYEISVYYENDDGSHFGVDANFYGMFSGTKSQPPTWLAELKEVKLAGGHSGFFMPISCGGSCAPANLWWVSDDVSYNIQLKLFSSLSEQDQEKTITKVANSAILAGRR